MPSVIQTDVEIDASASQVWGILTDFARYYEWNPFVTSVSGELRRGQTLDVTLEPPDQHPLRLHSKVLEVTVLGSIKLRCNERSDHQVLLEQYPGGVRVSQLQRFEDEVDAGRGLASDRLHLGFEMMNAALKARAER